MSFSQQLSSYVLGTWITQQTMYNLVSNSTNNIQTYKILKEKILLNKLNQVQNNGILHRYLSVMFSSKDHKHNIYLKFQGRNPEFTKALILFNSQDNVYSKKLCNLSNNNTLQIYTQYSKLCTLEKFWYINQNLILSVNLVLVNRSLILITFESRIRTVVK